MVVEGCPDATAVVLAPLAVHPDLQRQGAGSLLIRQGLQELEAAGADVVLVYGDPDYYGRFGFAAGHNIPAPYKLSYPDAWMACELQTGKLKEISGVAHCVAPLMDPSHW